MMYLASARAAVPPANDEAHSTPHAAGLFDQKTQCSNFKQNLPAPQVAEIGCTFDRLARQFEKIGLHLYWLNEPSVLVSAPNLGMSRSFPDLRTAKVYLSQVGGAA